MPRRRTVDLRWNTLLNDFRRSGLAQAEFCRRRQVSIHSFRKHLYAPRSSQTAPSDDRSPASLTPSFLPVTILPDTVPPANTAASHLELILPQGRRIAVAPGFDPDTLRRLLAVVEDRPCSD